jgi:glycosyltransferase involved in cell wall biosynthesis
MPDLWRGICVVDPWLRDYIGHDFNYASSIGRAIISRCLQFKVLAADDCMPAFRQDLGAEPVFRPLPTLGPPRNNRAIRFLESSARLCSNYARFSSDLAAIDTRFLDSRWIVFLENANQISLLAWSRWLRRFEPASAPAFVVMLRYSYFDRRREQWRKSGLLVRLALRTLENASRHHRIRLAADSQLLAREYQSLTHLPVGILPTPLTCDLLALDRAPRFSSSGPLKVLLPGRPSLSKGIATFILAIKRLADRRQLSGLAFTFQDYETPVREPQLTRSVAMLRQWDLPAVRIVQKPLNEGEYNSMLSEADLVVLPYFQEDYHAMVSGPFVEALALGKPVVVTEGTWMSAQLAQFGAGLTVKNHDADDLARVICLARDNYRQLAERAAARRDIWTAFHNPSRFVDELLKVAEAS